jgi:hypothetical protein
MFPFMMGGCCQLNGNSRQQFRQTQLEFLRFVRDGLETRLSAVNAAISTLERQNNQQPENSAVE